MFTKICIFQQYFQFVCQFSLRNFRENENKFSWKFSRKCANENFCFIPTVLCVPLHCSFYFIIGQRCRPGTQSVHTAGSSRKAVDYNEMSVGQQEMLYLPGVQGDPKGGEQLTHIRGSALWCVQFTFVQLTHSTIVTDPLLLWYHKESECTRTPSGVWEHHTCIGLMNSQNI
jgi:hypothetical protein